MAGFLNNITKGINSRIKKSFQRPLSQFDIGWLREKILKHQAGHELKYQVYKKKYRIAFRDAPVFLFSINEMFVEEFYKFPTNKNAPKIIDCGSYIGTSILYFKTHYPDAVVLGFEPDKENFSILKENIDCWKFSDTRVVQSAIWINNEKIAFQSTGDMVSKITTPSNTAGNEIQLVSCVRLKDLLQEPVDFLKIDIEGAEYEVILDCEDELKNVQNIFLEYHGIYEEQQKLNELLDILLKNNFKYYIKEAAPLYARPFIERKRISGYNLLLNIFAFKE